MLIFSFRLYCSPAINLFPMRADPIHLDLKTELMPYYFIHPLSHNEIYCEIFSVDMVSGNHQVEALNRSRRKKKPYHAFESFKHEIECFNEHRTLYYHLQIKPRPDETGIDHIVYLSYSDGSTHLKDSETLQIELSCSNRNIPMTLEKGDLFLCEADQLPYFLVRNITKPTASLNPTLSGELLWTLISNLSLNYLSLSSQEALKNIIQSYDFKSLGDHVLSQINQTKIQKGIISIETAPTDGIFKGQVVRGVKSILVLDQTAFAHEGDLYLFAKVLHHFFSVYASLNSFHDLEVVNRTNGQHYEFEAQLGVQPLI